MSTDPAWTDAQRDAYHRRLAFPMGLDRLGALLANWLHSQNDKRLLAQVGGDDLDTLITDVDITGGKINTDTDVDGRVYVDVLDETPGAAQATIDVYNDSAKSVLVATGFAADGGTVTLVAQTGFEFAGDIDIGTIVADLDVTFELIVPAFQRARDEFDSTEQEDEELLTELFSALNTARNGARSIRTAAQAAAASVERTLIRQRLSSVSSETTLIDPGLRRESAGNITEAPFGLLEDHRRAQAANTGGSGVIKAGPAVHAAAVNFAAGGFLGIATGPTLGQRAVPGTITFVASQALGRTSAPQFTGVFEPDDKRRKEPGVATSIPLSVPLTIGRQFKDPLFGIESFVMDYSATIVNEVGVSLDTTVSLWSVTGLLSTNSDGGKLWTYYDLGSDTLQFYLSESTRDAQDASGLVTQITSPGVASAFTTELLAAGVVVNGTTGAALADGDTGNVDFNAPQITQPASQFTVVISETTEGSEWLKGVRDGAIGGGLWEPHTAAAPNLVDGQILAGIPGLSKLFGDAI